MKKYTLYVDGYIGYSITKQYVRAKLKENANNAVEVHINSYGGDVQHALDIRQQFVDHGNVTAYVFGMTASAATILAMGAKQVKMSKYALMLIHPCSQWVDTWGSFNKEELDEEIEKLQKQAADMANVDRVIASVYALRTGREAKEMAHVMEEERWLTADECLKLGLIDEIVEDGEPSVLTDSLSQQFTACGLPLPRIEKQNDTENGLFQKVKELFRGAIGPKDTEEDALGETHKQSKTDNMKSKTLEAAILAEMLGIETLTTADDGTLHLTEEQVKTLENKLSEQKNQMDALTKQVNDLADEDGADTGKVMPDATENDAVRLPGAEAAAFAAKFGHLF